MMSEDVYCSENSAALGERLYGTAVYTQIWFLLEYRPAWAARATENQDNDLPPLVQDWLREQVAGVENGRLQFIKQSKRSGNLAFFVAIMTGDAPRLYEFSLTDYEDLLTLDMAALLAENGRYAAHRRIEPLYFICTHGKRDRCCAKFGLVFYNLLANVVGDQAWQVSHLGGHRFAVTALTLPDGVIYGRLQLADIPQLVAAQRNGNLLLDRLRGQTRYDPLLQTADYFLRQQTGVLGVDAFRLVDGGETAVHQWQFTFADRQQQTHTIAFAQQPNSLTVLDGCGKDKYKTSYPFALAAQVERIEN